MLENTFKFVKWRIWGTQTSSKINYGKEHTKIIVANGVSASVNPFSTSSNDTRYRLPHKEYECYDRNKLLFILSILEISIQNGSYIWKFVLFIYNVLNVLPIPNL
jgi:hypothetical protein